MDGSPLPALAVALGLGLLVGLQREWADSQVAGIRTFPLVTLLGALAGLLGGSFGGWILGAGLVAVTAILILGNLGKRDEGGWDPGITTEVAALVMFGVGATAVAGHTSTAIVVAGMVAVLLHWKAALHSFADAIGEADMRAVLRLVLLALVILPLLPDRTFGPYEVLNPHRIWVMVVLIVGISLAAYLAFKLLGSRVGTLLAGVLGGLISSTATTVAHARESRAGGGDSGQAAIVIMIASAVVFGRVLVEIAVVTPRVFADLAAPVVAMALWAGLVALGTFLALRGRAAASPQVEAPSNLGAAIVLGLLYGAVLFAVAVAKARFGQSGLYSVAALSGLTDMDAITLSTAQMVDSGRVEAATGWRMILVGGLSNLLFKGAAVLALGSPRLRRQASAGFALTLAGGALLLALWP